MVSILYTKFTASSNPFCIARTANTSSERWSKMANQQGEDSARPWTQGVRQTVIMIPPTKPDRQGSTFVVSVILSTALSAPQRRQSWPQRVKSPSVESAVNTGQNWDSNLDISQLWATGSWGSTTRHSTETETHNFSPENTKDWQNKQRNNMFLNLWNVTVNGIWENKMQGNNVISFPTLVAKEDEKACLYSLTVSAKKKSLSKVSIW